MLLLLLVGGDKCNKNKWCWWWNHTTKYMVL